MTFDGLKCELLEFIFNIVETDPDGKVTDYQGQDSKGVALILTCVNYVSSNCDSFLDIMKILTDDQL